MSGLIDIGSALVSARRAAGLSQAELGRHLGVAQPQIARWESARYRNASLERVSAVAEALGVTGPATATTLAAEAPAVYGVALTGSEPGAARALARTGANPASIAAFARSHDIERLELFGSILRPDFGEGSDVDILVTYAESAEPSLLDLEDHALELHGILRRPVDLHTRKGIEKSANHVRKRSILDDAKTLYARP
ncbi:MAG: XRE family transcriptional regulator [Coriobacteriia bacterium]|nr:XRE family transcriptional regulator [Coriobacteriia bacterium]